MAEAKEIKVGDQVVFTFGKKQEKKQGTVTRVCPSTVYLSVDFPKHKGKTIKRKKTDLA